MPAGRLHPPHDPAQPVRPGPGPAHQPGDLRDVGVVLRVPVLVHTGLPCLFWYFPDVVLDGAGRAGGAGEGRLADRPGGDLVTGGWITQADRSGWQQRAAAELAAILAAHPGIPVIAWTVTASGGPLSGRILAPAACRRGLFTEWRQALGLHDISEIPSANGVAAYLHAQGVRGGVTVSITATVFPQEEQ